jgi:hypothetical protein
MKVLWLFALYISFAFSGNIAQHAIGDLATPDTSLRREKVPGDNPAYYILEKRNDQLIDITEFTVSPYPPLP